MLQRLIRLVTPVFNLFLESNCPLCERSTANTLCLDCQRQAKRCQLEHSAQTWHGDLPLFAWGGYGGTLKQMLAALKYENQPQIARLLGHWLGEAWLTHSPGLINPAFSTRSKHCPSSPWVVPIPLHASKQRQRGYDQAALMAESFCAVTGLTLARAGLVRIRQTEAQFSLTVAERQHNLAEAFQMSQEFRLRPPTAPILLIDDIYTTGATARSAAKTLRRQGISVLGIGAIARAIEFPRSIRKGA